MAAVPDESQTERWPPADVQTIDFIFGYVKDAPERQGDDAKAMDSKATQVLTASGVALTIAGVANPIAGSHGLGLFFLVLGIWAWGWVALYALRALWIRDIQDSRQADVLWDDYRTFDETGIKVRLIQDIADAYRHNDILIRTKAVDVKLAMKALTFEVAFVALATVFTRL